MLNYLDEMSRDDIHATFHDTCLRAFVDGTWRAVRVVDVMSSALRVITLHDNKDVAVEKHDFDLTQSDLGMMWYRGNLFYISRYPERQWRRGLRSRGLIAYKLKPDGAVEANRNVSYDFMCAIALNFLERQNSHNSVINRDFGRRGKLLFFRNIPIGEVDKNNGVKLLYDMELDLEGYHVNN